ncbi:hypothetical protein [Desertibacillus haloalkaliphilus]|uniref:hypothetical protein n=1 Tax=Desertibacillus haloalkaliphilus TaxID=1328930 RepID=UPI001C25246D|nr:hypothetical protein [Desertibacillus haloalkaliphilus]MBU8908531.1 hypothetical protein [Desertibacillus haloalkaliphilus]
MALKMAIIFKNGLEKTHFLATDENATESEKEQGIDELLKLFSEFSSIRLSTTEGVRFHVKTEEVAHVEVKVTE